MFHYLNKNSDIINLKTILNGNKSMNLKKVRMERKEQFYKNFIQEKIQVVFPKNAINCCKIIKDQINLMKFTV